MSDWISDVCSSDLTIRPILGPIPRDDFIGYLCRKDRPTRACTFLMIAANQCRQRTPVRFGFDRGDVASRPGLKLTAWNLLNHPRLFGLAIQCQTVVANFRTERVCLDHTPPH